MRIPEGTYCYLDCQGRVEVLRYLDSGLVAVLPRYATREKVVPVDRLSVSKPHPEYHMPAPSPDVGVGHGAFSRGFG